MRQYPCGDAVMAMTAVVMIMLRMSVQGQTAAPSPRSRANEQPELGSKRNQYSNQRGSAGTSNRYRIPDSASRRRSAAGGDSQPRFHHQTGVPDC